MEPAKHDYGGLIVLIEESNNMLVASDMRVNCILKLCGGSNVVLDTLDKVRGAC
jgi:hypothetical protein